MDFKKVRGAITIDSVGYIYSLPQVLSAHYYWISLAEMGPSAYPI